MTFHVTESFSERTGFHPAPASETSSRIKISGSENKPFEGIQFRERVDRKPRGSKAEAALKPHVSRRLHGFFIQQEGTEARVAFVYDGKLVHYFLPYQRLEEAGVTVENQPFEMDEYETLLEGIPMKGYKITAAARPEDCYPEVLPLDERSRDNLNFILANARHVTR